jgi:hypothetical protein
MIRIWIINLNIVELNIYCLDMHYVILNNILQCSKGEIWMKNRSYHKHLENAVTLESTSCHLFCPIPTCSNTYRMSKLCGTDGAPEITPQVCGYVGWLQYWLLQSIMFFKYICITDTWLLFIFWVLASRRRCLHDADEISLRFLA